MVRASVVCISHGGGPLPVIGGPGHRDIIHSLKNRVPKILKIGTPEAPRGIVCVTAHWSEHQPTISSASHHDLYYDYGGLPSEAYSLKYNAMGSPAIAGDVKNVIAEEGFTPILNRKRGESEYRVLKPLLRLPAAQPSRERQ
ncbi:hypothetical protein HAV15_001580 [Penicillium sp. str. |nr:hypothetical protein HAV15_001580 [Penicillium sp. str. \